MKVRPEERKADSAREHVAMRAGEQQGREHRAVPKARPATPPPARGRAPSKRKQAEVTARVADLMGALLDEAPRLIGRMRTAAAAGDGPAVEAAAGELRAASLTFGAAELADAAREAASLARAGAMRNLPAQVERCEQRWAKLRGRIEQQLGHHPEA